MTPTIDVVNHAARKAYRAGLCVLPPVEDGTKRPQPVNGGWDAFKRERPTPDLMKTWYPGRSGIGIVAGTVSGGREPFDFDDRPTYTAYVESARAIGLDDLVRRVEDGYCDDTPGGGVRWIWCCPGINRDKHNQKLARRLKQPEEQRDPHDKVKVLIELPDYAIVAPSNGRVHPSGAAYIRRSGDFDTITTITADERQALVELACSFDQMPIATSDDVRRTIPEPANGLRPGDDYVARTTWTEVLSGWRVVYQRADTTFWRRPGKDFGISATTNHRGSDLLYVFSTSTEFEAHRGYNRFSVYAILNHGGDFKAAAKALAEQGYGARSMSGPVPPAPVTGQPQDPATSIPVDSGVTLTDFYAYMPSHTYLFAPSRELWPGSSVNARIQPITVEELAGGQPKQLKATAWLDQHRSVEQMTWAPGMPMLVEDRLVSDGGWIGRPGCRTFNLYLPPQVEPGDPAQAEPWLNHLRSVYPQNVDHIVAWLAQRVQAPHVKVNHALVLGGLQGIGKDTLLEPVKYAIGPWNFAEVSPGHLQGQFNGFVKSIILRISEARDLGEVDRYKFYDHIKIYTAAPPDVLRVNEKNVREYAAWNVCGVVITTNHRTDGLYLPSDDRRHYVAWSDRTKADFPSTYWTELYHWYAEAGRRHVAAYLASYDLSRFDPKAPPPKTAAFWDYVDANRAPEDAELADALDRLNNPRAVTLNELAGPASATFAEWLRDRRNSRQIPHRMEALGYVKVRNPGADDGMWRVEGRRQNVYVRHDLPLRDQLTAAGEIARSQ